VGHGHSLDQSPLPRGSGDAAARPAVSRPRADAAPPSARDRWGGLAVYALVFLLAWAPRALALGRFVTPDEPMWVLRTVRFWHAIGQGHWSETVVSGHPGVLTVWLGGVGIAAHRLLADASATDAWNAVAALPGLPSTDGASLRLVGPLLPAATWPVALAVSLAIVLCYHLARQVLSVRQSLLFAGLLALEPFYIGLSRVFHVDALQTAGGTVALLAAAAYSATARRRYVALSAAGAALAALAKLPGLYVVPWALLLICLAGPPWSRRLRDLGIWLGLFLLTGAALWPALWVAPAATLQAVAQDSLRYATQVRDTSRFFLGREGDPPAGPFYALALAFRLSPLGALGVLASPLVWRSRTRRDRWIWLGASACALGYILLLSRSAKVFDRYLLPTLPAWILLAALGWDAVLAWPRWPRWATRWATAVLLVIQLAVVARAQPYYLAWYSPLAGGLPAAGRALPVGWGEGLDQVAAHLRSQPEGDRPAVAVGAVTGLAPLVANRVLPLDEASLPLADLVVRYISDRQVTEPPWLVEATGGEPLFVASIGGLPYAAVYRNATLDAPLAAWQRDPQPVVAAAESPLTRRAPGSVILPASPAEVVASLTEAARGGHRLWLATLPLVPSAAQDEAAFQLASHADRLAEHAFPQLRLTEYALEPGAQLGAEAPLPAATGLQFGDAVRLEEARWSGPRLSWTRALGVRLSWERLSAGAPETTVFLHLSDAAGHLWGQLDQPLFFDEDAPRLGQALLLYPWPGTPPGRYQLWLGVYRSADGQRLPLAGPQPAHRWLLGDVTIQPPLEAPEPADLGIPTPLDASLGPVRLLGAALPEAARPPGQVIPLSLFWESTATLPAPPRLRLALEQADRSIPALDEPLFPCEAPCPWPAGERRRSQHDLTVPATLDAGSYRLVATLAGGGAAGGPVEVGQVTVGSAR
jgi:4-amino-4-deoxy-L-arabinose transferase-like glycosyltransferase